MITLTQPIPNIIPAYNRVNYSILSDQASQVGFKYVVKLFNGNDELMSTMYYDTPPNPATETIFDIGKLISTYFDFKNGFTQSGLSTHNDGIVFEYYLKCYEYYAISGVYQIVTASEVVTTPKFAIAASLPLLDLNDFYSNYTQYNGAHNSIYKPLTDWTSIKCRNADSQIISFINQGHLSNIELFITLENNTTSTVYINAPAYVSLTTTQFKITPMTYGAVKSIDVYVNWNNGTSHRAYCLSIYTQSCGKYEPIRVAYLNNYGAYDFFNFDLINRATFNIDRQSYQRNYNADIYIQGSNIVKQINATYYTKEKERWRLISDYLTDEQSYQIRTLYSSPLVYGYFVNNINTPSWIPMKLIPNTYELKTILNDKLFNIELEVEYDITNTRQSV